MTARALRVALTLVGVALVVTTVAYRLAYGTWWQAPDRITYCDRTYLAASQGLTLAAVRARESHTALPGDKPYPIPIVTIGKTPPVVGAEMLAAVTPEAQRQKLGVPCTMGIYLKTADDAYTAYSLSGGP